MEKSNDKEKPDILYGFVNRVLDERNRGRSLVFVDDKLLEWVDRQVDGGKYLSRSYAIECALAEMKERGKSDVSSKVLDHDLTGTAEDVPQPLVEALARALVSVSAYNLEETLQNRFGFDNEAKIRALQVYLEKADQGSITMLRHHRKAYSRVLSDLKQKRVKNRV